MGDDDARAPSGSMPMSMDAVRRSMRLALETLPPFLTIRLLGGLTHLPDITMVAPVFMSVAPSSGLSPSPTAPTTPMSAALPQARCGLCREIYQEGIRIPPLKIMIGVNPPEQDILAADF